MAFQMCDEQLAIIRGISANPDEDTPRLEYADWLDEHNAYDRDTAMAEFIRLSCLMRGPKAKIVPWAARAWLMETTTNDRVKERYNWERMVPTLAIHMDRVRKKAEESNPDLLDPLPREYPIFYWRMDSRWLRLKHFGAANYIAECIDIEFVRGFANRVIIRYKYQIDAVLPLIVWDQPIMRPEFHVLNGRNKGGKDRTIFHSSLLGSPASLHLTNTIRADLRPDNSTKYPPHILGEYVTYRWEKAGEDNRQRRADAIAAAVSLAVNDVITRKRQPLIPPGWTKYTLPSMEMA